MLGRLIIMETLGIKPKYLAYTSIFLIGMTLILPNDNGLSNPQFNYYNKTGRMSNRILKPYTSKRATIRIHPNPANISNRAITLGHKVTQMNSLIGKAVKNTTAIRYRIKKMQKLTNNRKQTPPRKKGNSNIHVGIPFHDIKFIIENKHLCENNSNLDNFIYIYSAPAEFEHRKRIRDTWGKPNITHSRSKMAFFIGQILDKGLMAKLMVECKQHKDIVLLDYIDSYRNVTHKGVMALKWMNLYCNNSRFYIKVDTDVLLNVFVLKPTIEVYLGQAKRTFLCKTMYGHVRRTEVAVEQYPATRYPLYCHGTLWIFTADLLKPLYLATFKVPFIGVEDAYTSGLLPRSIGHVRHLVPSHPWIFDNQHHGAPENKQHEVKEIELLLSLVIKPELYYQVWRTILERIAVKYN